MLSPCADDKFLLENAFHGLSDGSCISHVDRQHVNGTCADSNAGPAAYGELLPHGVAMLLHALRIDQRSVFYDLGSGRGAVVLQAALATARPHRCVGVELSKERHAIAWQALLRLRETAPDAGALERVRLSCEDLRVAAWTDDATEVYVANLLFPDALDAVLCSRLADCKALRRVATLKPLATAPPGFSLACRLKLPFSWAERCGVYVYSK